MSRPESARFPSRFSQKNKTKNESENEGKFFVFALVIFKYYQ